MLETAASLQGIKEGMSWFCLRSKLVGVEVVVQNVVGIDR
jgi:hypothetical protein